MLRECDTTRDFCHEQKQQAGGKISRFELSFRGFTSDDVTEILDGILSCFLEDSPGDSPEHPNLERILDVFLCFVMLLS